MLKNDLNAALAQEVFKKTADLIKQWGGKQRQIYVVTYCLEYNDGDDSVDITIGYNTESQALRTLKDVDDPREARWYPSCMLQSSKDFYTVGKDNEIFSQWYDRLDQLDDAMSKDSDEYYEVVSHNLKLALCGAIQELHKSGVLTETFGSEIPAIVYDEEEECDFDLDNLKINQKANGTYLPKEFIEFYREVAEA